MQQQVNSDGLVPLAVFARAQKVSRAAATKWSNTGRIDVVRKGRRVFVDPVKAKLQLQSSEQTVREVEAALAGDDDDAGGEIKNNGSSSLTDEKILTERQRNRMLALQVAEKEGLLIDAEQVAQEQETAARLVRKAQDAIPSWADDIHAAAIDGGSAAVRKLLKAKVREMQNGLARSMTEAADVLEAERVSELEDA